MTIRATIQSLDPGALIELFEVDVSPITKTNSPDNLFRFHAGTNKLSEPVVWAGLSYIPFPIQASGFDKSTKGTLPRPSLQASNVSSILTALNIDLDDMVGAKVTRRRTFARYIDAVNFAGGVNPTADPNQQLPVDVFFVERKVRENNQMVEWELASTMDLEGVQLPARAMIASYCSWQYRIYRAGTFDYSDVDECSYTGSSYFTIDGVVTANPALDVCSKTLKACKKRFGDAAPLPFGGFPGARVYRS